MKCKWAVMSTITSTREPSSWLLCSQIDELFLRHCPLLTTLGSAMPSLGWGPVEGSWRVGGEHPPWQRSAPELAVPDIPAWTSASTGLRSPAPPASSLAVWSSEDARAQLAAGMESRAAVLTSSRDPRPVGYPGKLWWDRGDWMWAETEAKEWDPCQETPEPVSSLSSGNSQGERCWHFQETRPLSTSVTALPGVNTIWHCMAGCFYNQTRVSYQLQNKL